MLTITSHLLNHFILKIFYAQFALCTTQQTLFEKLM